MDDLPRGLVQSAKLGNQQTIISRLFGVDRISSFVDSLIALARDDPRDALLAQGQRYRQLLAESAFVQEYQPLAFLSGRIGLRGSRRKLGSLPCRKIKPVAGVRVSLRRGIRRGLRLRAALALYPIALPLEGISGQRDSATPFAGVKAGPVHLDTARPKLAQGREQTGNIRPLLPRMAHGGNNRAARGLLRVKFGEGT